MTDPIIPVDDPRALVRAPEQGRDGAPGSGWWLFREPAAVLEAGSLGEVPEILAEAEAATRERGLWAVGFVTFEAASAFDPALATHRPARGLPLAWFALFPRPDGVLDGGLRPAGGPGRGRAPGWAPVVLEASITDREYLAAVSAVHDEIARGETYQANLTYRLRGALAAGPEQRASLPEALFRRLLGGRPSPYATLLELGGRSGGQAVCSASPELFFDRRGRRVVCRPMKGTAPRGSTREEDLRLAAELRASPKERAENLMIVDMVRNDLGRIARTGSVRVERLFTVEEYPTVLQMTSEVSAETGVGLGELFAALFPCASVTGAPKVRTMEILRRLEPGPRGVYTGALGWIAPGGDARFSVAIRTAWLAPAGGPWAAAPPWEDAGSSGAVEVPEGSGPGAAPAAKGSPRWWIEYGTGSGVVWDSDPRRELAETRTKAVSLRRALGVTEPPGGEASGTERGDAGRCRMPGVPVRPSGAAAPPGDEAELRLLETLLWTPGGGFVLLDRHLERLASSARALGFGVDPPAAARALERAARNFAPRRHRVRLLAERSGEVAVEARPAGSTRRPWRVTLAGEPVDPGEPLLLHKTTRRGLYERALAAARARHPEVDDVLLWNDRGELTESTVANLVVAPLGRGGPLLTPPVSSGLLPGTFRAELLARGRVREAVLAPEDLARAGGVYLVSSVRGWIPVRLVGPGKNLRGPAVATSGAAGRAGSGHPFP